MSSRVSSSGGSRDSLPIVDDMKATQLDVVEEPIHSHRVGRKTFEEDDSLEIFYKPIEAYEGRHRYDPKFEWDNKEERRIVRKVSGIT